MNSGFICFVAVIGFVLVACLIGAWDERENKKAKEFLRIVSIKKRITDEFDILIKYSNKYGNEYYNGLIDFAEKMEKLEKSDIKSDLRPYDTYNRAKITNRTLNFLIVIDKNLVPKFLAEPLNSNQEVLDIELEAGLTSTRVRELAEKCRSIKMDTDIETYRKEKVNNVINN